MTRSATRPCFPRGPLRAAAALLATALSACIGSGSIDNPNPGSAGPGPSATGTAGATGSAGSGGQGTAGSSTSGTGTAGSGQPAGSGGTAGITGAAGASGAGVAGTTGGGGGRGGSAAGRGGGAGGAGRAGAAGTTTTGTAGTAGTSGGAGTGGVTPIGPGLTDLAGFTTVSCTITPTVTPASGVPMVGIATFTTNLAGAERAVIQFGKTSTYTLEAPVNWADTTHRTLLLGMPGNTTVHYRVVVIQGANAC